MKQLHQTQGAFSKRRPLSKMPPCAHSQTAVRSRANRDAMTPPETRERQVTNWVLNNTPFKKYIFYLFVFRRGERRGRERETLVCGCHLCAPNRGTQPATQACAQTGNRTGHPLVCRPALGPLSHTSQGNNIPFLKGKKKQDIHSHGKI